MPTQRKIDTVAELTDKLSRAKAFVLADYRGLKHKQLEELRKLLKKVEAEFVVAKNRLFKRVINQSSSPAQGEKAKSLESHLADTTGVLFSFSDEINPVKELIKFFKTASFGRIKAGFISGEVFDEAQMAKLATLPTRQALLGQLVSQLNGPIQGLHYALNWNISSLVHVFSNIKDQKSKLKIRNLYI